MVDDDDYEKVSQFKWFYVQQRGGGGYARRYVRIVNGRQESQPMHQFIWGDTPAGFEIDHADGNGLNNQKRNLRLATRSQNNANRRTLRSGKTSKYRGVHLPRARQKWHASITVNNQPIFLGEFTDEEAAGRAYNEAAEKHFGEFAILNEIQDGNPPHENAKDCLR